MTGADVVGSCLIVDLNFFTGLTSHFQNEVLPDFNRDLSSPDASQNTQSTSANQEAT